MKKAFLIITAITLMTACLNRTDLDGDPDIVPEICCDANIQQITLPAPIEEFDVAGRGEHLAITWREDSSDLSRGWISVISAIEPEDRPLVSELEPTADRGIGVWHPQVLWYSHDPAVFYSRYNGDAASIAMKVYHPATNVLGSAGIMPLEGHVSLARAVHHPTGELAFSWTSWRPDEADPRTWFTRLTEDGEPIESYEVGPDRYTYAPRIKPTTDGYAFAYTANDDPERRRVFSSTWSFDNGFSTAVQLNPDVGRYTALDLAASGENSIVLWRISLNPSYSFLNAAYLSWVGPEGLRDSILLDDIVMGTDVLESDGEALVSWCSMNTETLEYSLTVARASGGSFSSVLHMSLGEQSCDLTQLALLGGNPTVFWAMSGTQELNYRMLCD